MKKILGLDLGTNSIGWALVNESESNEESSSITRLGVRIIQYDNFVSTATGKESREPEKDFKGGKGISPNDWKRFSDESPPDCGDVYSIAT